jgi:hypothetical protein
VLLRDYAYLGSCQGKAEHSTGHRRSAHGLSSAAARVQQAAITSLDISGERSIANRYYSWEPASATFTSMGERPSPETQVIVRLV